VTKQTHKKLLQSVKGVVSHREERQNSVNLSIDSLNESVQIKLQYQQMQPKYVVASIYKDEKSKVIEFGAEVSAKLSSNPDNSRGPRVHHA
jgi:hypothetical protein